MKNRFIFFDTNALIEDYMFYHDNTEEIDQWLNDHHCAREGMVLHFFNIETLILFKLAWS